MTEVVGLRVNGHALVGGAGSPAEDGIEVRLAADPESGRESVGTHE
jgi:hypothetical protein